MVDWAGESFPFDGPVDADGNSPPLPEQGWESIFGPLHEDGVLGVPGDSEGQVYADGSGMLVKRRAAPVGAMVKGHRWRDPLPDSWPVDPGDSQPRIDRIVLRLDPAGNRLGLIYRKGTPSTTPTAPPLVRDPGGFWDLPWAQWRVEANTGTEGSPVQAINAAQIYDERPFRGIRVWQFRSYAHMALYAGAGQTPYSQLATTVDTGDMYRWNSVGWELYVRRGGAAATESALAQLQAARAGDVPPSPWNMGVSTAWNWPVTQQFGVWWRRDGLVEGHASAALNYNPPYANTLSVNVPGYVLAEGRYVGEVKLMNFAGQVKAIGPLVSIYGVEAYLRGFDAGATVTPAYGDIVTADFYFTP
jgi:hypothetical protein